MVRPSNVVNLCAATAVAVHRFYDGPGKTLTLLRHSLSSVLYIARGSRHRDGGRVGKQ